MSKLSTLLFLLLISFFNAFSQPANDNYANAIDVSSLINGCSVDAAYTTISATGDLNAGTCWNNSGPRQNVWFKFVATTTNMKITVDIGSGKGTQQRTQAALWQADGTTQVACKLYAFNTEDVILEVVGALTIGNTYYISVDTYNSGYDGTFSLCLADNDVSYDFYEGAIDVSSIINSCSADAAYTTIGATSDRNAGSCWNNSGPRQNRWFKFVATTTNMKITVDIGSGKGTQQRTQAALWEDDGTTEVACKIYAFNTEDVILETVGGLTIGETYYISIDTYNSGYDGTFSLCLADNDISYDFYEGATLIEDINNWCSSDAAYTTIGATGDKNAGSCWNNSGPRQNRWFKFVALSDGVKVRIDIGGTKGTQQRTQAAIWEDDGTTQVTCKIYAFSTEDVIVEAVGSLTSGNTYYISVDTYNSGYDGTFTLCLDDSPTYDFYEGAFEITDLNNWCSADAEFTTIGASPDKNAGSCWNNSGPRQNRWFKFTAISNNVTITVDIGSGKGTQQRTQLALWESDGTTEVDCQLYASSTSDVSISNSTLIVGNVYYISVDTYNSGYDGTFTLCVSNIDGTYYSITDGSWATNTTWSITGHGGSAAADYPQAGDLVYIESDVVTITGNETCAEININAATNTSDLIISSGTLNVQGKLNLTNSGSNVNSKISVVNGTLTVNDNISMNRNGGTANFALSLDNSILTVNQDLEVYSTAGTNNNTIDLFNSSTLVVNENVILSNTGGPKTLMTVNNSTLTITLDLEYIATSDDKNEITLTNSGILNLKKDVVRGTPAYGILNCASGTTVNFNSTEYLQIFPNSAGSGTGDVFTYENVTIDNSRITSPQLTMDGPATINGSLTLTDGNILTTTSNLLTIVSTGSILGGSQDSYIDGPIKKIGNQDILLPTGDGSIWAPVELANLTGDAATEFTAEYHDTTPSDVIMFKNQGANTLNNVSRIEYWELSNSGSSSNADVTLHWLDQNRSEIDDYNDLVIAHYDGSEWENLGQDDRVASDPGSITVDNVSTFSPFTFGSLSSSSNPLPVELISFSGTVEEGGVVLKWSTASELNNDYFEIERSVNGIEFESLGEVPGMGTSSTKNDYSYIDYSPVFGIIYYRLKQVDYDGQFEYSNIISVYIPLAEDISISVFPNPFSVASNISYTLPEKSRVRIILNSISGRPIKVLLDEVQLPGIHTIPLHTDYRGMMIIQCDIGGKVISKKLIKQ